jgi:effector-binding domain-containing protein
MKALKYIGLVLLLLVILIAAIGLILPAKIHVERSIVVNTTPEVPFNLINDLSKFNDWSPWYDIDTNTSYTNSEITTDSGAWISWKSENPDVGNGKLSITESKPNELIVTKLEFEGWDPSGASYLFTTENNTTKITWSMDSDMGYNVIGRWFGLFMDKMIGKDYDKGLAAIKKICEEQPVQDKVAGFDVNLRSLPEQNFIYITNKDVEANQIGLKIGESLMKLDGYTKENKLTLTGPPFTVWYSPTNFVTGLPIASEVKVDGNKEIKQGKQGSCDAYVVSYYGAYSNTHGVYENMSAFITEKGKRPAGPPRELYLSDPMLEKDTAKWLTEIVFPVQ